MRYSTLFEISWRETYVKTLFPEPAIETEAYQQKQKAQK
jgi:hypothetical protein